MSELRIQIDQLRLDEELVIQPKQRLYWGERLADAQLALDEAKAELEVVKAEMDKAVRDDPELFGIAKVTESAVSSALLRTQEYREAVARVNAAKHEVAVIQAAVSALEHRKRALSDLVVLQSQEYFASPPSMPAGVKRREGGDG